MSLSRRDLGLLLPVLAAAGASAQEKQRLTSKVYRNADIPYDGDAKKKAREFFRGAEHSGFGLEVHETVLGAGVQTHAPHKHVHEEIIVLVEGTLEALLETKTQVAEAGSVIYLASDQMHSVRNAGSTPCRYYVVELRGNGA
jgi:quercetin dioxygenase-like cupin family protein